MAVPETPMDEDRGTVARQNQIRLAGHLRGMQPEPEAARVKPPAH